MDGNFYRKVHNSSPSAVGDLTEILNTINDVNPYEEIARFVADANSVFDVGCGDGRLLKYFPISQKYLGVDISSASIDFAEGFFKNYTLAEFQTLDVEVKSEKFPIEKFDIVCAHLVFHLFKNWKYTVVSLFDRVNSGGKMIFVVPAYYRENESNQKIQNYFQISSIIRDMGGNQIAKPDNIFFTSRDSISDFIHKDLEPLDLEEINVDWDISGSPEEIKEFFKQSMYQFSVIDKERSTEIEKMILEVLSSWENKNEQIRLQRPMSLWQVTKG